MANAAFGAVFNRGIQDEKRVKKFLESRGFIVTEPTDYQDKREDIDCFVNGISVSIKAQHSGLQYGNICMELSQQYTSHKDCLVTPTLIWDKGLCQRDLDRLELNGSWEKSWYFNGKADYYAILQGDTLKTYAKVDIQDYVNTTGFLRLRPLTAKRSAYLGGSYRYCNSICGYIPTNAVKNQTYYIPNEYV